MKPDFQKQALIPVIVQDYQTKQVLMMAYTNEEAYQKMLESGETWFWSRSRQKLWHKGEESGHFQKVKGMRLDCDQDTFLVFVEQTGNACHTGAYSCFYDEVIPFDDSDIFADLEKQIADRKAHPVEKSYTNYLLDQGIDKVLKKVGEEASEVIIASKNSDKTELLGEIDDLLYHLFVLMNQTDISLEEVRQKARERHQIEGNKKKFHTRTAD
ncbi:bifunctional phosphoribosyl-AMP cyclohydrolase/phosphoribosyl-ATP diphosphatase HisIE [Lactococcus cremoris]|uniref:Histidine biosynthesis bifunctional protein HisIE n=3 Tax=Lactococcus lactis subsp. cremoris TaxID=1359 RepID=A0A1V0P9T7_LACLC|nr:MULTISPECIES: bifunctional phosphoribosyl-AMP cyclohydrolase/phosphoribosyl-ATP diphosphatase HisIE [Lactococcus]EQC54048.1 phosphoribosyl-ATP pyrophosphatase [Lactococcus cremoris subsp. cremoris TIFN5]EQC87547.1 phosphoribosyl-ATP pyrophosphatase [Lactococcus cremoris subsp. cremoris TIFN1]EQC88005.1 phosphoribosyl-ATP pyrophosphatase [Lactococcus cremoris subsp. cremoris TIFN7]EQC95478.1 phosphoribosyl-ATP pyrophosphatase [Lactococcus cremoris subsp. cremoris TIFN3]ABJ72850.1 phosphoribo